MKHLINNLSDLTQSKREYLLHRYQSDDDILVGIFHTENEACKACSESMKKLKEHKGWKKGDIVNSEEVESVSIRIEHQDDSWDRGIDKDSLDYDGRLKASMQYWFYIGTIVRRYVNPLSGIYTYDDEINGATAIYLNS